MQTNLRKFTLTNMCHDEHIKKLNIKHRRTTNVEL